MGSASKVLLAAALLAVWATGLGADAADEQQKAQMKLMAHRAARADAVRRLAERIRGLHITSETYVKDFVAESDRIATAMHAFLAGAREVGKPKHMEDGTCEVTMEVTLKTVIASFKQIRNRYYKGSRFKADDFEQMTVTNKLTVLRETGAGLARGALVQAPLIPTTGGRTAVSISKLTPAAKAFWMAHCAPQGRLMAERTARVVAMRNLAERIKGAYITSETTVQDFVAESDQVNVGMSTFLKGAREIGVRYHDDELVVEVEMQVKLRTVYATLKTWGRSHFKGNRAKIDRLEELIVRSKDTIIRETGFGVPPARYLREATAQIRQTVALAARTPAWVSQPLRATGRAVIDTENPDKTQAKLMAFRAAELDARRKMAEQVNGLTITSDTSVRDFVAQSGEVRTAMLTFQQGVRVLDDSKKIMPDGTAKVTVEVELKPLWNMIMFYQRKLSITIR